MPVGARGRALAALRAMAVAAGAVVLTYWLYGRLEDGIGSLIGGDADDNLYETAFFLLFGGVLLLLVVAERGRGALAAFGFGPLRFDGTALRMLGLAVLLFAYERLTIRAGLYGGAVGNGSRLAGETTLAGALNSVVLAPLTEEMLFRGYLFGSLRALTGLPLAMLVSAAAFALFHFENGLTFMLFVAPTGLLLAYVREKTGSISLGILLHALMNGVISALWLLRGLGWA